MANLPLKRSFSLRSDGWTRTAQNAFLSNLAVTGNARDAAHAAGRSVAGAYRFRQSGNGADFKLAWDQALADAYENLLAIAQERIRSGGVTEVWFGGGVVGTRVRHDNGLLVKIMDRIDPDRRYADRPEGPSLHDQPGFANAIRQAERRGYIAAFDDIRPDKVDLQLSAPVEDTADEDCVEASPLSPSPYFRQI